MWIDLLGKQAVAHVASSPAMVGKVYASRTFSSAASPSPSEVRSHLRHWGLRLT
jgi:hypothetical protein